jgi:hypothetical protein
MPLFVSKQCSDQIGHQDSRINDDAFRRRNGLIQ